MLLDDTEVRNKAIRNLKGLHLLHFGASPCSQKVRILLNEKNLAWKSHHVDLRKQQHVTPGFLGVNPRGVVPVLIHDGAVHVESNDIMEYVDSLRSARAPFFPKKAEERDYVREELAFQSSLRFGTRALTVNFLPSHARYLNNREALDKYRNNGIRDLSRDIEIAWWQSTTENGLSRESLADSLAAHRDAMRRLEDRLNDREWLFGKRVSVLDIAWFTTVHRLKVLGYNLAQHPYLLSWYQRLILRPPFGEELQIKGPLKIMVPAYRLYRRVTGSRIEDLIAD
jgi:glutathione S-transferase